MSNVPQKTPKRNDFGLLENVNYVFNEDGSINWRAMILPEFLYVNPNLSRREELEKKYNKPYKEINPIEDKVADEDLVQLLSGIKFLLRLYGYTSIHYRIHESNENYASVNCQIDFIGNYLSEMRPISFEDNACATLETTKGFGQRYLLEMATNRSLSRCVRNFLNINILYDKEGFDTPLESENSVQSKTRNIVNPIEMLAKAMSDNNLSFETLKLKTSMDVSRPENAKASEWKSIQDIDKVSIFYLLGKIKNKGFQD